MASLNFSALSFFVSCAKHLESLLEEEIHELGISTTQQTIAGVSCQGSLEEAYRLCLWSRLANRVLLHLSRFKACEAKDLYEAVQHMDWSEHLEATGTFYIEVTGHHAHFNNTLFIAQVAKDAIVDQLRTSDGRRPSVEAHQPDVRLHLHCRGQKIALFLDLSGESLHRRGYRLESGRAPLKETLAAAMLYRAGWPQRLKSPEAVLLDPFCGTGTLVVEAALMAYDMAPGLWREHYGFTGWKQHDPSIWEALTQAAKQRKALGLQREDIFLYGRDTHPAAIQKSRENIRRAGLLDRIDICQQDCRALELPRPFLSGLILTNPPYGQRMGHDEHEALKALFQDFGKQLRRSFLGWQMAMIFDESSDLPKFLGFRTHKQYALFNGAIACKLYCFSLSEDNRRLEESSSERQARLIAGVLEKGLSASAEMLSNRLKKNAQHLKKWLQKNEIDGYRLYDADLPEYAFAIDVYQTEGSKPLRFAHVQEYEPGPQVDPKKANARRWEALAVIHESLNFPSDCIIFKTRKRQRGESQYERLSEEGNYHILREGAARFWVNFTDYLDTGIFLDHRSVRRYFASLAPGKTVLNLFAYTGTVGVQAALAGATRVVNVDLSRTYLDWAAQNFKLNPLKVKAQDFIQADCFAWLSKEKSTFDLIFLNPPTFSNSKKMQRTLDILRDQKELINLAMHRLNPGGTLIFSCHQRGFQLEGDIQKAYVCRDLSRATLPKDFLSQAKRHHVWEIRTTPL